jgi:hypothetical protein
MPGEVKFNLKDRQLVALVIGCSVSVYSQSQSAAYVQMTYSPIGYLTML